MGDMAAYDEDILRWSEQQAGIVRRLVRMRGLPNELDIENVAEEIESVGRSELAAVESYVERILAHLIKLGSEPNADAARKWRSEIVAFHGNLQRRYAPSMRSRVRLQEIWRQVREQAIVGSECSHQTAAALPQICPLEFDDFLGDRPDALHERFSQALSGRTAGPA
jgi:hypothetical protein